MKQVGSFLKNEESLANVLKNSQKIADVLKQAQDLTQLLEQSKELPPAKVLAPVREKAATKRAPKTKRVGSV